MRYAYAPAVKQEYRPNVEFGSPANYRILVQGHVGSERGTSFRQLRELAVEALSVIEQKSERGESRVIREKAFNPDGKRTSSKALDTLEDHTPLCCRRTLHTARPGALALAFALLTAAAISAQTQATPQQQRGPDRRSVDEIAAELANPNNALGVLTFNFDTKWYGGELPGASDQSGFAMLFQPSFPYPLGPGTNLFVRPAIPFIASQPIPRGDGFESEGSAIGDIGFDVAVGKGFTNGWLAIGGMIGSLPTATNDDLGLNRTLLGPEFLLAKIAKRWVFGILVNQSWNVTHRDDPAFDTSITGGQYFIILKLKNGWQVKTTPLYSYNRNATSGNKWSFPVGGGVSKTSILGTMPWKFEAQYWYSAVAPDAFGSRHQIRVSVSPVVPLPW